jgi:hypothetical protein
MISESKNRQFWFFENKFGKDPIMLTGQNRVFKKIPMLITEGHPPG